MGGMVLETNMTEILTHIEAQNKIEKQEVTYLFVVFFNIYLFYVILKCIIFLAFEVGSHTDFEILGSLLIATRRVFSYQTDISYHGIVFDQEFLFV